MQIKVLNEGSKMSQHDNKCTTNSDLVIFFFLKIIINNYKYNFCLLGETGLPGEPGRQGLQGFPGPKGKLISKI